MIFGLFKKKVSAREKKLDEQDATLELQAATISELCDKHECTREKACEVCREVIEVAEQSKKTAVVAKEISSRKIQGRSKTDIIRRDKLGLAAGDA